MFFLVVTVFKDGDIDICNAHAERPGITHPPILAQFKARIDTAIRNERKGIIQMRVKTLEAPGSTDIQPIQNRFRIPERINGKAQAKGFKKKLKRRPSSFWSHWESYQLKPGCQSGRNDTKAPCSFFYENLPPGRYPSRRWNTMPLNFR